ncbi:unnamed protein product [Prunus armeniaca]|uniref:Uncharacterized protein n=1 Tax=Prunus armeniaca TaxID=36596 RepID=A0A6J5TSL4_PRUAR|nr:unnamed protein product [Prunus armeniaca]
MAGPSPSSAPSTPSTHTPGEVISMPALPHSGSSSKPLMMFGPDGTGTLTSPSNQLWDDKDLELQADMDRFVEDGSLDDNVESFLSHDDMAVLWYTDTLKVKSTFEEHSALITDVRFSPSMPRLAMSSFDKTVRVWDADKSDDFIFLYLLTVTCNGCAISTQIKMTLSAPATWMVRYATGVLTMAAAQVCSR